MEYMQYYNQMYQAGQLSEKGHTAKARRMFEQLLNSDISDIDKSMICMNIAMLYKKQRDKANALKWFDKGIGFEQQQARFFVTQHKASYLQACGRIHEASQIYRDLITQPYVTEKEKYQFQNEIARLSAL